MNHIQSETQFLDGKAGMVPCGTWLYAEMEGAWPPGVTAEFMLPPPYESGKGDKSALMVAIEPFVIPSKAKNKDHGVNYYRYITSKDKALQFVEEKGTLMGIKVLRMLSILPTLRFLPNYSPTQPPSGTQSTASGIQSLPKKQRTLCPHCWLVRLTHRPSVIEWKRRQKKHATTTKS